MKKLVVLMFLLPVLFYGQTPAPTTPNYFVSLGAEYNHYAAPAMFAATASLGVKMSDNWWQVTTISMQPTTATVRAGAGYAVAQNQYLRLIVLADLGVTTQAGIIANLIPVPTSVTLGNVGGGALLSYDLGGLWSKLKDKGFRVTSGIRIAAVTSVSVQPAVMIGFAKMF